MQTETIQQAAPEQEFKHHPLADLPPAHTDGERAALRASIEKDGQLEPGVVHKGQLLDGRHRRQICRELNIPFQYVERDDVDPVTFFLSRLPWRHLSESRRAMLGARLANLQPGRPEKGSIDPISREEAARRLNVGVGSIKRAHKVLDGGCPELIAAVYADKIKVSRAAAIASKPHEEQLAVLTGNVKPARASRKRNSETATGKPTDPSRAKLWTAASMLVIRIERLPDDAAAVRSLIERSRQLTADLEEYEAELAPRKAVA